MSPLPSHRLVLCCCVYVLGCGATGEPEPSATGAAPEATAAVSGSSGSAASPPAIKQAAGTSAIRAAPQPSRATGGDADGAAAGAGATVTMAGMPAAPLTPQRAGAAGSGPAAAAGSGGPRPRTPLDCGPEGIAIEDSGPPRNRVNYVIIGDGYTQAQLPSFRQHIEVAMKKRFSPVIGQPYGRYRKFVNICALQLVSPNGPIGSGPSALDCTGDDQSRLARCDTKKVNEAIAARLPESFEVDWKAVVLNNDRWWNTGAVIMLWSGAHKDAAGAALHEGGHGFHQLADEYGGSETDCNREFAEVNTSADPMTTAGKWDLWLGYDQADATGMQTALEGSRYCMKGQYRPSQNSMMNQLFGDKPNTAYNAVSREKMIMDIWRAVTPIDETLPPVGPVQGARSLEVIVIDPEVIAVDWMIDGELVSTAGGASLDLAAHQLGAGTHTVSARAYDTAGPDWVRYTTGTKYGRMNWSRSQQTVTWSVQVP